MTPRLAPCDVAYATPSSASIKGNGVLDNALSKQFTYLDDLFHCEFGVWMVFTKHSFAAKNTVGVLSVLRVGHPLKVAKAIVGFDPILVIYLVAVRIGIWFKKRQGDETMRITVLAYAVTKQCIFNVTKAISYGFEEDDGASSFHRGVVSHAPKIAYRVRRKLRDCFPHLHRVTALVRHLWPFSSRLLLFRCAQWRTPLGTPNYC